MFMDAGILRDKSVLSSGCQISNDILASRPLDNALFLWPEVIRLTLVCQKKFSMMLWNNIVLMAELMDLK